MKIYEKAPKRHPTSPERRPIEPKKRPKGPRRPLRENTGDPRGTEEEPKEGESRIPRNWLYKSHDPKIPKSMKNLVKTVSFAYSQVLENKRKKIEPVKTIVFFSEKVVRMSLGPTPERCDMHEPPRLCTKFSAPERNVGKKQATFDHFTRPEGMPGRSNNKGAQPARSCNRLGGKQISTGKWSGA